MASPLDHDPQYQHYWSYDPRDTLFSAYHNSFSSKFSEATATFMFLPIWGKQMVTNPFSKLITAYPISVVNLEQSHILTSATMIHSLASTRKYLSQHTWDLQIVAVWNASARIHLNNHNPAWLQGLASA
eukprot:651845-Pelagomonas_calceolata.AAC.1